MHTVESSCDEDSQMHGHCVGFCKGPPVTRQQHESLQGDLQAAWWIATPPPGGSEAGQLVEHCKQVLQQENTETPHLQGRSAGARVDATVCNAAIVSVTVQLATRLSGDCTFTGDEDSDAQLGCRVLQGAASDTATARVAAGRSAGAHGGRNSRNAAAIWLRSWPAAELVETCTVGMR